MAIWNNIMSLEQLQQAQHLGMARLLGVTFTEIGDDFVRGRMTVTAELLQPAGILHGGGNVVLAETLGSTGAMLTVDRQLYRCVGQEVNANHLRPVPLDAVLTGTARPIHIGARSQVWGIEIRDERERLTCISRLTMAVIDRQR
jgi:1,4-dihydroxy-2-naphthoyl-CoA hydrolase